MTMHSTSVFFKQHEFEGASINGPRRSSGSDQPLPVVAYGELAFAAAQSEVLSAHQNRYQGKGKNSTHFTLFSGECKSGENGEKTPLQTICSDHRGHFELGFGQPLICDSKYPYAEQCYGGVYSTYGTQIAGRMMLPLSRSSDEGPIFVNAKQYSGIMRRRKKRAEAEAENNRLLKLRKPYLHLSRHLHAMRRPRGNGGRFLNTKNKCNESKEQQLCDGGGQISNSKGANYDGMSSRSTSPGGSEVISSTDHESLFNSRGNNVHPSFQINHHQLVHCPSFEDVGLGMGIGMVSGNNYYLKV